MIIAGVKLMFIGMTTVMLFLLLMICLIQLVSYLTRGVAARELAAIKLERELMTRSRKEKQSSQDADDDIAAITAAVTAFEMEKFARS